MTAGTGLPTGAAKVAGVIGWPVAHSRSPRLHGTWLRRYGIDGAYIPLPVVPERVAEAFAGLPALGLVGANVTVPHKEAALRACASLTERARRVGAVNTLTVREDGSLHGDITDGQGFLDNLRAQVPDWRPEAGPAVVLGAGGSARAVVEALASAGVPAVRVLNRSPARAEALAADLGGPVEPGALADAPKALRDAALLVNTTTLGMSGQPPLDLDLAPLPPGAVVADLVYAPLDTDLLARARARGLTGVDGLGMLIHQARPGFAAWFGVWPEVTDDLRELILGD